MDGEMVFLWVCGVCGVVFRVYMGERDREREEDKVYVQVQYKMCLFPPELEWPRRKKKDKRM